MRLHRHAPLLLTAILGAGCPHDDPGMEFRLFVLKASCGDAPAAQAAEALPSGAYQLRVTFLHRRGDPLSEAMVRDHDLSCAIDLAPGAMTAFVVDPTPDSPHPNRHTDSHTDCHVYANCHAHRNSNAGADGNSDRYPHCYPRRRPYQLWADRQRNHIACLRH